MKFEDIDSRTQRIWVKMQCVCVNYTLEGLKEFLPCDFSHDYFANNTTLQNLFRFERAFNAMSESDRREWCSHLRGDTFLNRIYHYNYMKVYGGDFITYTPEDSFMRITLFYQGGTKGGPFDWGKIERPCVRPEQGLAISMVFTSDFKIKL